ncbi:MAG: hypothetical protein GTO03_05250, partial [Planctomycetales bacterium]|nr:hypothetical protein [Planctomycetales bacterium]
MSSQPIAGGEALGAGLRRWCRRLLSPDLAQHAAHQQRHHPQQHGHQAHLPPPGLSQGNHGQAVQEAHG